MNRREFLRNSLVAAGALGLKLYSIPAFALDGRKPKLIYIFLRGGADFLSLFPPKLGPILDSQRLSEDAKKDYTYHPLFRYRGETQNMQESFLFGSKAYPFGGLDTGTSPLEFSGHPVDFHPGFGDLETVIRDGRLAVILHAGSISGSRSHFEQQDMIESGSARQSFSTGYLARAASLPPGRNVLAIGPTPPKSLAGADAPLLLSPDDVRGPISTAGDRVRAARYDNKETPPALLSGMGLAERLDYFKGQSDVNCESSFLCRSAGGAQKAYEKLGDDLKGYTKVTGSDFLKACSLAATLTNGGFDPAIMAIDFPGWDHHFGEHPKVTSSPLYLKVSDLAQGLKALYDDMSQDTVVVVMSEFGRTVDGNQSLGTDHGRGGAMMLMGKTINAPAMYAAKDQVTKMPLLPQGWDLGNLEGEAGSRALQVKIDYRQVMAELFGQHLQIPWKDDTSTNLPDRRVKTVFDDFVPPSRSLFTL